MVTSPSETPVVILGAGLTGLSTALHLAQSGVKRPIVVIEREERVGGKARSERHDGYTFDVTGHWLHLRDDRVRALVERLFSPGDLVEIERRTGIYTHGVMLPYPFQANLHGLPLPVVRDCLVEFMESQIAAAAPDAVQPRSFEQFAVARFGAGIARHFFIPYNRKLWGEHYDSLTPDWVSRFVPMPDASQVIGGAIGLVQEGLGYNVRFLYPRVGGIDALPEALAAAAQAEGVEIHLSRLVTGVDPDARVVTLDDGTPLSYHRLVSTLPMPELVRVSKDPPAEVSAAAASLRWVRWRYLDVATRHAPPMKEHWVYVPEPSIPFFRVGVFSNALPAMAPPGGGSLYVELADRDREPDLGRIFEDLAKMGAIASPDDVVFARQRDIEYAYVVFDEAYHAATDAVHRWLEGQGIRSCGRYGSWVYNSMEDSIIAGMDAAGWVSEGSGHDDGR
jgi:protoporphyrinogen oxidase